MKVIYRFSDKGYPKNKLPLINNENCYINFCNNFLNGSTSDLILIMDNCSDETCNKFELMWCNPRNRIGTPPTILRTNLGNAGSYVYSVDYAISHFTDDEIVYFVEGDFIHDVDSRQILESGYNLIGASADYVTLYAHPDKELPENIQPEYVFRSKNSYWRSCISTVMTCSAKVKTLREDYNIIKKWTDGPHPRDHEMFTELRGKGRLLISSIPGYSTHGETAWLSPLKNWSEILENSIK